MYAKDAIGTKQNVTL